MAQVVRWRGTGLSNGSATPEGRMYAGDAGEGDTPGPHIVECNNALQSRPFITNSPWGVEQGKAMELHQFIGAPMWVGWHPHLTVGVPAPLTDGYHIRYYVRGVGKAITPNANDMPMIHGYGPDGGNPNSKELWRITMTDDASVGVYHFVLGGTSYWNWPHGRKFILSDVQGGLATGVTPWQAGGDARYGLYAYDYRCEIRCSPTGLMNVAWFDDDVDPDVPRASHTIQLSEWEMDTFVIHARVSYGQWRVDQIYDNIEIWDDYDANRWMGPYVPHDPYFEEVTAPGVTSPLTVEGEITQSTPPIVAPFTNGWEFNEEYVLPPFVPLWDEVRNDAGSGGYLAGFGLGHVFLPDPEKFAGPHPWTTWAHSGFFQRGSPSTIPLDWVGDITARGIAVISIKYPFVQRPTLVPTDYNGKVKHPVQVVAVKSQWKYLEDNARNGDNRYNLHPDRGFMMGYSAGANLSQAAAMSRNLANFNGYDMRLRTDGTDPAPLGVWTHAAPCNWQRLVDEDATGFIAVDTVRAYMGGTFSTSGYAANIASLHLLPAANAANMANLKVAYILGTQDTLIHQGNLTDLQTAMTAAGLAANFEGHLLVADHDNIDTVADATDPTNGCLQWFEAILGANMPTEI